MITKISFNLPNGGEIIIMDIIGGKLVMVEKDLPKWDAPDKYPIFEKETKPKKANKKKSDKYFDGLQND